MGHVKMGRRGFLAASAAAAVFNLVPRSVIARSGMIPPGEKMNIAGIGVGGMGAGNIAVCAAENIVALCDVDANYAAKTFQKYPQAKIYSDFRQMLDKEKNLDGVVIATPDHTHAVISLAAMQCGLQIGRAHV